ncbi:MAG: peptide deformylase, partial [Pseudomonadota bacterium]
MSILPIITVPQPVLRETSAPVERVDDETRQLIDDMFETMYDAPGVGLAAIQVGVPLRVVVLDVGHREDEDEKNPI